MAAPRRRSLVLVASLAVAVALIGAVVAIAVANARLLDRRYPVREFAIAASPGAESAARGRHLADITGCTDCHGADLRGRVFIDEGWWRGRYHASNLTLKARSYSDADLARIVRDGVRPDGRGVVAMPSFG